MSLAVKVARRQVAGDPGLFGSIGKFLGGALKTVGGLVPGVGGILQTVGGIISPTSPAPGYTTTPIRPPTTGGWFPRGMTPQIPIPGVGGAMMPMVPPGTPTAVAGTGLACPQGYKPNKSGYHLRNGQFVAPGTKCVRYRKKNPANARATDRAIARVESAKKMAARLSRIRITPECPKKH